MEAARHRATRALFERLIELPPEEQEARLAEVDDPELRREVRALLVADAHPAALEVMPRAAPTQIGPYRILRERGRGAMGTVYEVEEQAPRRIIALKVMHPWLRTPALEQLARQEAQALADVRHPGIPRVYALVETDLGPVVAMDLVDGVPLETAAASLSRPARLRLLAEACEAVGAAHARGIVHRDLKPANVLVSTEGHPAILDFGIATSGLGGIAPRAGTPAYMPPEQARGDVPTPASDVYALGLMAWELLTGHLPAPGDPGDELREDLRAILRKATALDPAARYPDANALAADLRRAAQDLPVDALAGRWGPRLRALLRRRPGTLAAVALLVILAPLSLHPLRGALANWQGERILDTIRRGGLDDDRVDALLVDPGLMGHPVLAEAWTWRADHRDGDEALQARARAWLFEPAADGPAAKAFATALVAAGESELADVVAPMRAYPVATRPTGGGEHGAFDGDRRWTATGTTLSDGARTWTLPGSARGLSVADGVALVRGDGWLARVDGDVRTWALPGDLSDAREGALDGAPTRVAAIRFGEAGVYVGVDTPALIPSTRGLPARALALHDTDGDGDREILVAATGWAGHELRVLDQIDGTWTTRSRLRMSAWDLAVTTDGTVWVLGGVLPTTPSPLSPRRWLVPLRFHDGVATPGAAIALDAEGTRLLAAGSRLAVDGLDAVGLVEPDGRQTWLPGSKLIDADENGVWIRREDGDWRVGVGKDPLPALPRPALPEAPARVRGPLRTPWSRAMLLAGPRFDLSDVLAAIARVSDLGPADLAGVDNPDAPVLGRTAARLGDVRSPAAVAAHAFDTTLAQTARIDGTSPLPPVVAVGRPGTVRRIPLSGRLALDLLPDDPPALSIPLTWAGRPLCVDLDLDVIELDWAAGITVRLRRTSAVAATLWRVGGGPASGHQLNLTLGTVDDHAPFSLGAHTMSVCVTTAPDRASLRLDGGDRRVATSSALTGDGPLWLDLLPATTGDYSRTRRARVDVRAITLRGATLASGPVADPAGREVAEGTRAAPADGDLLARLRRDPVATAPEIAPSRLPALLAEAWEVALSYDGARAGKALLAVPMPAGAPVPSALGLARAAALLEDGRAVEAEAELARIDPDDPAALLLRARVAARSGRPDAATAALRRFLAVSPSPEAAADTIADDPELAARVPDLAAAPVWTASPAGSGTDD